MSETIKQKILFALGVTGSDKASMAFTELSSKVVLVKNAYQAVSKVMGVVIKAIDGLYDSAIELSQQMRALTTDMTKFNIQTGSLIDTNAGLKGAIEAQEAGLKLTRDEMGAVGAAAVDMAKKLGTGPEGATTQYKLLMKSIITARETGLIKFGIELTSTADKTKAAKEALGLLVEKYGNVVHVAETAKEKLSAFQNSLGTVMAIEFDQFLDDMSESFVGLFAGIDDVARTTAQWETDLLATNGALAEQYSALTDLSVIEAAHNDQVVKSIALGEDNELIKARLLTQSVYFSDSVLDEARAYNELKSSTIGALNAQQKLAAAEKQQEMERAQRRARAAKSIDKAYRVAAIQDIFDESIKKSESGGFGGTALTVGNAQVLYAEMRELIANDKSYNQFDEAERFQAVLSRAQGEERAFTGISGGGGGGGGKKKTALSDKELIVRQLEFSELQQFDIREKLTLDEGSISASMGLETGAKGAESQRLQRELTASQDEKSLRLAKQAALEIELGRSTFETMLGLERQYMQESAKMSEMTNRQKADSVNAMATSVAGTLTTLSQVIDKDSRAGFEAHKKVAYSANAIDTAVGATAAFKSVMQSAVPYPANLILGSAAAGMVAVKGGIQGSIIRSQKYGGGGSTPSSNSTSFPSGGSLAGSGSSEPDNYTINVNVDGNTIHQSLMTANDFANQSGSKHFTTEE